ncbi:MAG: hypothetical protein CTR54_07075 [Rhizobium sp.]|nr:MAG: hypothetical protein CTR54_07075 [Rhizobium sp.]
MTKLTNIIAAVGMAAFVSGPSLAACPEVTGSVDGKAAAGISKDGTHVPLEGSADTQANASGGVQKDGNTMPLATDKNLATSGQDVAAQQQGEETAAASAANKDKCTD